MSSKCLLEINLGAIRANYKLLKAQCNGVPLAATVKANAYGLGIETVALTLFDAGCRQFFVANSVEALELSQVLSQRKDQSGKFEIYVIYGYFQDDALLFEENPHISPVLNNLAQIMAWSDFCSARPTKRFECIIHTNTGMHRLGILEDELKELTTNRRHLLANLHVNYIISHLSVSEDSKNSMNAEQLAQFKEHLKLFPGVKACFGNSGAVFLDPDFHFDLVRPGVALYSVNPVQGIPNPMHNVVTLRAPVVHLQNLEANKPVGYGMKFVTTEERTMVATLPFGYADGFHRDFSFAKGRVFYNGHYLPVIGLVSMDLVTVDATAVRDDIKLGDYVEVYGPNNRVDEMAARANTIGYEILTSLGKRYKRIYTNAIRG